MATRVLTLQFPQDSRCDRCDNILRASVWKDIPIALVLNSRRKTQKYHCIHCATKGINKHYKNRVMPVTFFTSEEVNDFIRSQVQMEVFVT